MISLVDFEQSVTTVSAALISLEFDVFAVVVSAVCLGLFIYSCSSVIYELKGMMPLVQKFETAFSNVAD